MQRAQNIMVSNDDGILAIARLLHQLDRFAYLIVDCSWRILAISDNLSRFGFSDCIISDNATDHFEMLVGLDVNTNLRLPIISSPSGVPINVQLLPDGNKSTVIIQDASQEFRQQRLLQQKANENELLLDKQQKLMIELEQKNLALAEASRLQNGFLSGVSHEFRTPLGSIIGYSDVLLDKHDTLAAPVVKEQLLAISRASRHLLSLVENLLDHGKLDNQELVLNPQPTSMRELFDGVSAVMSNLAQGKSLSLEFNIQGSDTLLLDGTRLRQCLINLIGNSIKFTDCGGIAVHSTYQNNHLDIAIVDTGIGISEEDLQQVKTPFWQAENTGQHGTGLGLTITQKIVDLMGGELNIASQPGEGTCVNLVLPVSTINDTPTIETAEQLIECADWRFLLVDDDDDISALVSLLLVERGVKVEIAGNGLQALELLGEHEFDLVLMDLQMPHMDGYSTTEALRKTGVTTPVLMMTASAVDADRHRAEAVGCDGYLTKPVDINSILTLAAQFIGNGE